MKEIKLTENEQTEESKNIEQILINPMEGFKQSNSRRNRTERNEETAQPQQEEQPKKVKKRKKRDKKTTLAFFLAAVIIAISAYFIKGQPTDLSDETLLGITDELSDTTYFDEILASDEKVEIGTIEAEEVEEVYLRDAVATLENYVKVAEEIEKLNIDKNIKLKELTDEAKVNAMKSLEEEGIDTLIELYNDKDNNEIEKARIAQQLLYIESENNKWLHANGLELTESILNRVIKSGAIYAYGTLAPNEYSECVITEEDAAVKNITIVDPQSGAKDYIKVTPLCHEYNNAIKVLNKIKATKQNSKNEIDLIIDGLNAAKRCVNKEAKISVE